LETVSTMSFGFSDNVNVGLPNYQKKKRRKPFSIRVKKIEWMKAGGHDPYDYITNHKFVKTSRCRKCKRLLAWKDGSYDFDHKDNNPANSSQRNCWLVCKSCHGKATRIGVKKERDIFGNIRYKTIKRKVGYKKSRKKQKRRKRKKKAHPKGAYWTNPLTGKREPFFLNIKSKLGCLK
jgi:hypothetical protein